MRITLLVSFFLLSISNLFAAAPTVSATNLTMTGTQGDQVSINFTRGDGARRIVVIKLGSAVTFIPSNATNYLASNVYGNGQEVLPGEFVVYNSTGSSFSVSGLLPGTLYHIAIFEFNGTGLTSEYLVAPFLSGSAFTLSAPTVQPTGFAASDFNGNSMTISWLAGDGAGRIVLAKQGAPVDANPVELTSYTTNKIFGNGSAIGNGNYVVYKGSGSSVDISNLNPDTTYHFAIFEMNGTSGPVFLTTNPLRGNATTLAAPTVQASNLSASQIEGNRFTLSWTRGNGSRCIIVAKEGSPITDLPVNDISYTAYSIFTSAPLMSPNHKVIYNGTGQGMTLQGLSPDSTYYLAMYEFSGSGTTIGYMTSTIPTLIQATKITPTIGVTNLDTIAVNAYNAQISFTPGNGEKRLIVYKVGSPVDFVPIQFTAYSHPSGWSLGNGNFLAYRGDDIIAGFSTSPNTRVFLKAFEFNGQNNPVFNLTETDTLSFLTDFPPAPNNPAYNLSFSAPEGNSFRAIWTRGTGDRRMVIMRKDSAVTAVPQNGIQYSAENSFNLAPEIAPGQKVVYDGTGYFADFDSLEIGTRYYIKIFEYNGSDSISTYLASPNLSGFANTYDVPLVSASNVHFTLLSLNELRIWWTRGSGTRRLILARKNGPVNAAPENLKAYSASTYFGSGSRIGDSNYVVFNYTYGGTDGNNADTVNTNISSIDPGNTYHFAVFEYNGVSGPVYKQINPATGNYYVSYEPTTPSSNFRVTYTEGNDMSLYWTRGGGDNRVIVAREGLPVDAVPADGVSYVAKSDFRLAPEVAPGQRVVYNAAGYATDVQGLKPGTRYYFKIFEYGGTGAETDYLTSVYDSTDSTTNSAPSIQLSNINFSAITPGSGTISWTNGNGENRIVVAKKGAPVDVFPADTTNYASNSYFAYTGGIGNGNYVVYKNNASNFNLSQLESGTTYHLALYEMNGRTGPVLLRPPVTAQFTTLGPPQVQAVIDSATFITNNSMHLIFTKGSGQKRLVLMKKAGLVNAEPVDNISYIDNTYFGSGDQLGTGNYVVYNGTDDNTIITGLEQSTTYHIAIFEYNSFSAGTLHNYLRPTTAIDSFTTIGAILPVNWLHFSGTLYNQIATLNWATATEQHTSYFEVERSLDGNNFTPAGKVTGSGNSNLPQHYQFYDQLNARIISVATNVWYRIKQVNTDGSFTFSKTILLKNNLIADINIYPNPVAKGQLINIQYNAEGKQAFAQVYNTNGKLIMKKQLLPGRNSLSSQKLGMGIYFIRITNAEGLLQTTRIVVE